MPENIDFVITWVSGTDPEWMKRKEKYQYMASESDTPTDDRTERYRDWGLLRYLLRGIACNAPWVHRVFLVIGEPCPSWINTSCEKLRIVHHEDFLRSVDLPTFNANAIEVNLQRIPGLSEQFVYVNDDMFLMRPVEPTDFFVDGRPVDMLTLQPVIANPSNPVMSRILLNDSLVVSRHFKKRETMKAHRDAYFHLGYPFFYWGYNVLEMVFPQYTGFYTVHGPSAFLKHTFEELWQLEPEILQSTASHKIRSGEDVNQYLFREWQKQKGEFVPRNILRDFGYFEVGNDLGSVKSCISKGKKKIICINDTSREIRSADTIRMQLQEMFQDAFPQKCMFEC